MCLLRRRRHRSRSEERLWTCWCSNSISSRNLPRLCFERARLRVHLAGATSSQALAGEASSSQSSPERTHVFRRCQSATLHCGVQLLPRRSGCEIELCIQRIQTEEIAMRLAGRRAWPVVAHLPEVVSALPRTIVELFEFRNTFGQRMRIRRQVPKHPMDPSSGRSIRIIRDKSEAGGLGRRTAPLQRRRGIGTFASELASELQHQLRTLNYSL